MYSVGGMFSGFDEWAGPSSDEKGSSSGWAVSFLSTVKGGRSPDRGRSRAVCHKNHDRRDGFPTYSGLQRMEAVLYSAGSPNGLTAVVFVASKMIGHDTWLVKRKRTGGDGGHRSFCRFSNDEKGDDSPGHGSSRAFSRKITIQEMRFPPFHLRGDGDTSCIRRVFGGCDLVVYSAEEMIVQEIPDVKQKRAGA